MSTQRYKDYNREYQRVRRAEYRDATPENWDKALVRKHVYKSSTLKAAEKAYDNAHKGWTLDELKEDK